MHTHTHARARAHSSSQNVDVRTKMTHRPVGTYWSEHDNRLHAKTVTWRLNNPEQGFLLNILKRKLKQNR